VPLTPKTRFGPYEIIAPLGAGGMGEVYRARDTRLDRDVAIKALPDAFAQDPERLARFEREARVLASLNHPNIATIHGVEESAGVRALVMELVEGATLAERLDRGPLGLRETLAVGAQIAEALEAAHEKGVVHRDLKPANIKLTDEGKVKVLDFGLAKALGGDPTSTSASTSASAAGKSPTLTVGSTEAGMILGTAGYMSPEQARGRPVDRRADIWAFGTMLYEMLGGRRLFEGETVSDTLAAVLRQDVDWSRLPPDTPAALRTLLRHCLDRDPRNRLHDIADARIVLAELQQGGAEPVDVRVDRTRDRRLVGLAAVLGVSTLVLAVALVARRGGVAAPSAIASPQPTTFRQLTILPGSETEPALSPDGDSFVFVKDVGGQTDIFLQRVDGRNSVNLTASCDKADRAPAFSPDGGRIAFRSECLGGGIFVMGATGESARKITDFGYNPAWSPDGSELAVVAEQSELPWARSSRSELWGVSVATGERRRISEQDSMQPAWSPDGRRIATWGLQGSTSNRDVWTVAADGSQAGNGAATPLVGGPALDWNPVWSADGTSVVFSSSRGGTFNLWRAALDPATGEARGAPTPLTTPSSWAGWISLSRDGRRMIFVDRNARTVLYRAALDPRTGALAGPPQQVPLGSFEIDGSPALSPDGETVAFATAGLPQNLYLVQVDGSGLRQLTDGAHRDRQPSWSSDGAWIMFQSDRFVSELALVRPDGSGLREIETGVDSAWFPRLSPDDRRLSIGSLEGARVVEDPLGPHPTIGPLPPHPGGMAFWPISWSPDGRHIAGDLLDESRPAAAAVLDPRTGEYRQVLQLDGRFAPCFLPGGNQLVGTSRSTLLCIDVATRQIRTLFEAERGHLLSSPTLSADGRWVVWVDSFDDSDVWLASFDAAER